MPDGLFLTIPKAGVPLLGAEPERAAPYTARDSRLGRPLRKPYPILGSAARALWPRVLMRDEEGGLRPEDYDFGNSPWEVATRPNLPGSAYLMNGGWLAC